MTSRAIKKHPERLTISKKQNLRRQAEVIAKNRKKPQDPSLSHIEEQALIHELEVHQIELEMQKDELERARDEAEVLKEKYIDLYDFAPVGYFTLDGKGTILELNLTGSAILGKGRQELVQRRFQTFLKPKSVSTFNAFCDQILKSGKKEICAVEIERDASDQFFAQIEGKALPERRGEAGSIRIVLIDITRLKDAVAALQESEHRFRLALRNAPVSVATQDKDLVFQWAYNQRTVNAEDIIGKKDTDLFIPEEAARLVEIKRKVLETGKMVRKHLWLTMNKKRLFLDIYFEPLKDDSGNITGIGITTVDRTEQKVAVDSLRHNEENLLRAHELLEAVTKGTEVLIAVQDLNFRYIFFNQTYKDEIKRLTGKDLIIGASMVELFAETPEEQNNTVNEWSKVLHGENINQIVEFGHPGKDRKVYHVLHTPIRDASGSIVGAGEVAFDVTKKVQVEDKLRETKEYLDNLISYANAPIIVWDNQFSITRFNHAFEHLTGRKAKEVIGEQLDILFPQNYQAAAMDLIRKTSKGERWDSVEIPILHKKGEIRTVLWNSAAILGPDRKTIISTIAQGQDITARKKIESEYRKRVTEYAKMNVALKDEIKQRKLSDTMLKKTLSLLNASLESTADGILVVDQKGRITSYNQNFMNMWNIPRVLLEKGENEKVLNHVLPQLKNPGEFLASFQDLHAHMERESFDMIEFNDGKIFERYSKPQKIGESVVGRVWSYRDITDRKHAEEELVATIQEKDVLLREVHHRVKNNLQLISGLLDMTRMRTADESTNSILTDMMLKIQTMAQIHTRLYESKQFGKISLPGQIRDQIAGLSNIYSQTGNDISCEVNSQEIFLPVDKAIPCALVVNEILSNAFKHAFKGRKKGAIEVSAVKENGQIRINICDDGIGIPDNLDISSSNSLGLKLIRTLVEHQLKGKLMVTSKHGTEIIVEFPIHSAGI